MTARRFAHFVDAPPDTDAVVVTRVSTQHQEENGDRTHQRRNIIKNLDGNHEIITIMGGVDRGRDASWLRPAVNIALTHQSSTGRATAIFMESADRAIRGELYGKFGQDHIPSEKQLRQLDEVLQGITIYTIVPPDADNSEARSYQTKRGMQARDRMGGAPDHMTPGYKKRRRDALKPLAIAMRKEGKSLLQIARKLGVNKSTIQLWV